MTTRRSLIEDEERIADRIDDRLGKRGPSIEVYEQRAVRPRQRGLPVGGALDSLTFPCLPSKKPPKLGPATRQLPTSSPIS